MSKPEVTRVPWRYWGRANHEQNKVEFGVWRVTDVPDGTPRSPSSATPEAALNEALQIGTADYFVRYVQTGDDRRGLGRPSAYCAVSFDFLVYDPSLAETAPAPKPLLRGTYKGRPVLVWRLADIPIGIKRGRASDSIEGALSILPGHDIIVIQYSGAKAQIARVYYAAVFEDDLPDPEVARPTPIHRACPSTTNAGALDSLSARVGEDINRKQVSPEAREAWSAQLRLLTKKAEEMERNRVLVDLEYEPWE